MELTIERGKRKSLCLTLKDGKALVRAPFGISDGEIFAFVEKHRRWIENRQRESLTAPRLGLADGDTLFLFGRELRIGSGRARLDGDAVFLPAEKREAALIRLLKRCTAEYMQALTARLAAAYGFTYSSVRVSSARGRWGSCNAKGRIAYSFRAAFLPPAILEYLCVHELCHTRRLDHSAAFWREVEAVLPDWRARRKALRNFGGYMRLL